MRKFLLAAGVAIAATLACGGATEANSPQHLRLMWTQDLTGDDAVSMWCADNGDRIYVAEGRLATAPAIAVVHQGCNI